MFTKFWDKLAEGLAGQWTAQRLGPALAFWGGGLLAWGWEHDWTLLERRLAGMHSMPSYIALATGALILLSASSEVVAWFQGRVIRITEGYWPWPFAGLRFRLTRFEENRVAALEKEWEMLEDIPPDLRTDWERDRIAGLDAKLAAYPPDPRDRMPTTLGNLMRAAETYPMVRYGMPLNVCWPRLWLLLPKEAQQAIGEAREDLNAAARLFIWAGLFGVWTVWAWWAAPISLIVWVSAYWRMLRAVGLYGDLLRSAFDLHRFKLYESLKWPLPPTMKEEEDHGLRLSEYLFRGTITRNIRYLPEETTPVPKPPIGKQS